MQTENTAVAAARIALAAAEAAAGNRLSPRRDPALIAAYWTAQHALIDAEAAARRAPAVDLPAADRRPRYDRGGADLDA